MHLAAATDEYFARTQARDASIDVGAATVFAGPHSLGPDDQPQVALAFATDEKAAFVVAQRPAHDRQHARAVAVREGGERARRRGDDRRLRRVGDDEIAVVRRLAARRKRSGECDQPDMSSDQGFFATPTSAGRSRRSFMR